MGKTEMKSHKLTQRPVEAVGADVDVTTSLGTQAESYSEGISTALLVSTASLEGDGS